MEIYGDRSASLCLIKVGGTHEKGCIRSDYKSIKEAGIKLWEVNSVADLTEVLTGILSDIEEYKNECISNLNLVYEFSSWEYKVKDWYNVYMFLMERYKNEHSGIR